ncbi:MAG: flagellar assembly protein FliW [Lachnospiraceae bacterium]|nr:flagellar assembly protein FliW [Lachnospiraceae bacterium]
MLVQTRYFGEINLSEDKIISLERGLIGFDEYKRFTLLYDNEKEERPAISWLQSLDEPSLALPVVSPLLVKPDYNPVVEDELLMNIGELTEENIIILLTLTVPENIKDMTANLKAPIIINSDTRKGVQLIVENQDYEVKYNAYKVLKERKGE